MAFHFNNKNIIFLLASPELGGAERQALTLAGYLQNNLNCKVVIYSCIKRNPSKQFDQLLSKHQLKNFKTVKNPLVASRRCRAIKIYFKLFSFGLKLRKFKPDVIIPYLNHPSIIANYCKKISGARVAYWNNRGYEIFRKDTFEIQAVKRADFFLVNSSDSIKDMVKNLNVTKDQIHFIPNFNTLDTQHIKPQSAKETGEVVIGMLAHFRSEKLHLLLLKSFLYLSVKYPFIKLHLVGTFLEQPHLRIIQQYISENQIAHKVELKFKESGESAIPHFDIAVLVSLKEGMSNSLMEYMYFEKPIVCSKLSGNEWLLGHRNAYLVDYNHIELTEKLEMFINDPQLRKVEGLKNKKRLTENFSIERYVHDVETLVSEHITAT